MLRRTIASIEYCEKYNVKEKTKIIDKSYKTARCYGDFFYNFVFRDVEPPGDSDGGDSPRDDQGDGS